jgi:hypothetical protein
LLKLPKKNLKKDAKMSSRFLYFVLVLLLTSLFLITAQTPIDDIQITVLTSIAVDRRKNFEQIEQNTQETQNIAQFSGLFNCVLMRCKIDDMVTINTALRTPPALIPFERVEITIWEGHRDEDQPIINLQNPTQTPYKKHELTIPFNIPSQTISFKFPFDSNSVIPFSGTFFFSNNDYPEETYIPLTKPISQEGMIIYAAQTDPKFSTFFITRTNYISDYLDPTQTTKIPRIPTAELLPHAHIYTNYTHSVDNEAFFHIYIPPIVTYARTIEVLFFSSIQSLDSILNSLSDTYCYLNGRNVRVRPVSFQRNLDGVFLNISGYFIEKHKAIMLSCPKEMIKLDVVKSKILGDEIDQVFVQFALSNRTSIREDNDWFPEYATVTKLMDYSQNYQNIINQNVNQNSNQDNTKSSQNHIPISTPRYNHVFMSGSDSGSDSLASCTFSLSFSEQIPFNFIPFNSTHNRITPISFNIRLRGRAALEKGKPQWVSKNGEDEHSPLSNAPTGIVYFTQDNDPNNWYDTQTTVISRFLTNPVNSTYFDLTFPILREFVIAKSDQNDQNFDQNSLNPSHPALFDGILHDSSYNRVQYINNDTISITVHTLLKKPTKNNYFDTPQCLLRFADTIPLSGFEGEKAKREYISDIVIDGDNFGQNQNDDTVNQQNSPLITPTPINPLPLPNNYPLLPSNHVADWSFQPILGESILFEIFPQNQTASKFNITVPIISSDITYFMLTLDSFTDWYFDGDYRKCYVNDKPFKAEGPLGELDGPTQSLYVRLSVPDDDNVTSKDDMGRGNDDPINKTKKIENTQNLSHLPYGSELRIWCPDVAIKFNSTSFDLFPNTIPSTLTQTKTSKAQKFDLSQVHKQPVVFKLITSSPGGSKRQIGLMVFPIGRDMGYISSGEWLVIIITFFIISFILFCGLFCWKFCIAYSGLFSPREKNDILESYEDLHEFNQRLLPHMFQDDGNMISVGVQSIGNRGDNNGEDRNGPEIVLVDEKNDVSLDQKQSIDENERSIDENEQSIDENNSSNERLFSENFGVVDTGSINNNTDNTADVVSSNGPK